MYHAYRLKPGVDLIIAIKAHCTSRQIRAGFIAACVGSLTQAHLRLAGATQAQIFKGSFEILSLSGTVSIHGHHFHLSIADSRGQCIGGHALEGCIVNTTAELVIGEVPETEFLREIDSQTSFKELKIVKN